MTSAAGRCPGEILLDIVNRIVEWDSGIYKRVDTTWRPYFDAHRLRINALLACARVCKAWAPFAQLALYRDVHIVAFQEEDDDPYPAQLKAALALRRTLQTSPLLAGHVKALQISILWRDSLYGIEEPPLYGRDEPIANFVEMLALLPNLVQLDLTLDARGYSLHDIKGFEEGDIASISRSSGLRCLAVHSTEQEIPRHILYQLLRTFPAIKLLALNCEILGDVEDAEEIHWTAGVLPNLQDLRCSGVTLRTADVIPLLRHAPSLRTLALTRDYDEYAAFLGSSIPQGIQELILHDFPSPVDLTHLTSLTSLAIIGPETYYDTIFGCLRTASSGLKELAITAVDDFEESELVDEIADLIRGFPVLSRVYIEMLEGYEFNSGVLDHEMWIEDMEERIERHFVRMRVPVSLKLASHFDQYKPPYREIRLLSSCPQSSAHPLPPMAYNEKENDVAHVEIQIAAPDTTLPICKACNNSAAASASAVLKALVDEEAQWKTSQALAWKSLTPIIGADLFLQSRPPVFPAMTLTASDNDGADVKMPKGARLLAALGFGVPKALHDTTPGTLEAQSNHVVPYYHSYRLIKTMVLCLIAHVFVCNFQRFNLVIKIILGCLSPLYMSIWLWTIAHCALVSSRNFEPYYPRLWLNGVRVIICVVLGLELFMVLLRLVMPFLSLKVQLWIFRAMVCPWLSESDKSEPLVAKFCGVIS
ncbi:hypothetical protein EXIGLDRAFT_830796 [Exidia glandulosa HHB12029]|uniref:Uncharacterized protein n=1 Tax=Exidia glandulosa HHB12029 TaxID=1314781 RepID=A0A165N8Z0_EXIGL|nr:hypothetical protein EXIGLDRAFT_830796 [Exidia glandulosa HHB12029]